MASTIVETEYGAPESGFVIRNSGLGDKQSKFQGIALLAVRRGQIYQFSKTIGPLFTGLSIHLLLLHKILHQIGLGGILSSQ
jgi:hypothetical protein